MRIAFLSLVLAGVNLMAQSPATYSAALTELKAGNARWMTNKRTRTTPTANDQALRTTLAAGQAPFAVIVTCADSRLDETMIFDQEPGRLFVVREAGNAPDLTSVASIDYAVEHLHAKLVVVMGHNKCGAVTAVAEAGASTLPGNLWAFQQNMAGLLASTPQRTGETLEAWVARLIPVNARREAAQLFDASPEIEHLHSTNTIRVVPATYDLATGRVTFQSAVTPND